MLAANHFGMNKPRATYASGLDVLEDVGGQLSHIVGIVGQSTVEYAGQFGIIAFGCCCHVATTVADWHLYGGVAGGVANHLFFWHNCSGNGNANRHQKGSEEKEEHGKRGVNGWMEAN
jgi:hypothetical protein